MLGPPQWGARVGGGLALRAYAFGGFGGGRVCPCGSAGLMVGSPQWVGGIDALLTQLGRWDS